METTSVPIGKLVPDPDNARAHPDRNLKAIRKSLERFGQVEPLVVQRGTNIVVGGNGRLETMRAMSDAGDDRWATVPVVYVDVNEAERKAMGIALNRTSDLAEWDDTQLGKLLEEIKLTEDDIDIDALLESVSFSERQMESLIQVSAHTRRESGDGKEDEIPEPPKVAVTKLGNVWELGDHRLVCGGAAENIDIASAAAVDLVLTDPPYGIGEAAGKNKSRGKLAKSRDYGDEAWDDKPIGHDLLMTIVGKGAMAAVFGGNYYDLPPASGWLVWDKENGSTDFADAELVWTNYGTAVRLLRHRWHGMLRKDNEKRFHPTQKPVDVMTWVARRCPGAVGTILDPFLGSGTTIIAAEKLGARCFGVELSPSYCDVALERWENLTGGKARRVSA